MATKKELSGWLSDALPRVGGVRLWKMDYNRAVPKGAVGLSDEGWLVRGRLLFIEIKSDSDFPSDEQIEFMIQVLTKSCRHVHYILLERFEQIQEILDYV